VSLLEDAPPVSTGDVPEQPVEPSAAVQERTAALERVPPSRSEVTVAPAETTEPTESVETTPAPAPASSGGAEAATPRPGLSLSALGIGGQNPFFGMKGIGDAPAKATPPPAPSGEAPDRTKLAERRLEHYLVVGMLEHDRATVGSRNGAVVTALRDAALLISSPVNGQAEFVATIDATGLVTALRPTRVSANAADWKNVAARALKELAKKRLRVPAGTAGLEVRLALSSKIQLPSGGKSMGSMHTVPLLNEDGTRLSRLDLPPESKNLPDATDPGSLGTPMMKQPIPGGGLDGDLADIGGVSRRIVRVVITDERPL
jgi:hypothetical protein